MADNATPYELVAAESAVPATWVKDAISRADRFAYPIPYRLGPLGFEAYLRAKYNADDRMPDEPIYQIVLQTLTHFTQTPGSGFAAIWAGWTSAAFPTPEAPRVSIDEPMLLFTGPISLLSDAPHLAWFGERPIGSPDAPTFAWPADRAWCVTSNIDEELEFTVGCSLLAAESLTKRLPYAVRVIPYGPEGLR